MTVGIFANCTFCLKLKHLPRQQKKKLQTDIKENGGNFSFLLNAQCTHVILDSADVLSQYQLSSIRKNRIHIANPDFVWDSIKERRLVDLGNYGPRKSLDSTPTPRQRASSAGVKTGDVSLDSSPEKEVVQLTKFYAENVEIPHFPQDFEVAKYNTLEKAGPQQGTERAVVELRCSQDPGDHTFLIAAHFLQADTAKTRRQFSVKETSADASEYYENYIEELKKQGFLLREHFTPEATQLASEKLQTVGLISSRYFVSLTEHVSKAEGTLLLVKAALKNGETQERLQTMMTEFYRLIPHRDAAAGRVTLSLLAKKEDLCQLIRDMVNVCETNLSKANPPPLAKYRALRCHIEHVEQNTEEFSRVREELLQNNHSKSPGNILQIFRVGRVSETTEFLSQLGNVKALLHGSPVQSFVGILSRGLLLPEAVEDRGVERTDIGNLGSGIYFSDSLSTSTKYTRPGQTDGTRLLVVCDVALGRCADLREKDFSLTEAPPGYDSVHGLRGTAAVPTDFEDDEFVVYKTNQVKMKYIVKFCIPGDEVKDFHPCGNTELEEYRPEFPKFSRLEDHQLPDSKPFPDVQAGLQDPAGNVVPLEDVHIKGKIIDFVAQVVVFQTYTNHSHVPIEAKYVFPLDDKAAVCGFEAFIGGRHVVGEVKEKETAHREYREAVSRGHGAYLMDQDAPDVFTVSVGNLPPKAKVLIKITYITELSAQGACAVFFLPGTVAPWRRDRALNENMQDAVEKIYVKEIGAKQSFSLSMSIEMPYVIEFISSDTHALRQKSTDCKAVISTVEGSSLDSSGFSLHIGLSNAYLPRMWVEKHPEKESEACMLVFQPDLSLALAERAGASEVIICLDCSNSMEGTTFLQAKQIALHALSLVDEKQKINVVRFGTGYKELFSYPRHIAGSDTPTEFIMAAAPTMGNTDFWKLLRYLALLYPAQGLRSILLISDGHVQNESLTLRLVQRNAQHTRLFSCGVGSTANRHILRTLSQHGAGVFEYFNSKSKHSWKKQIEDQMTRMRSPSCHSVSVRWQQLSTEAPEPLQAPAQVQSLFHSDRLLVYGLIPHCTQATLCALIQEKEFSTVVSTTELQKTTGTMIHRLVARALIRDHEDGVLHEDERTHEMKKQTLKSLIVKLSKENSLVTQFTSFVAVEKRDGNESPSPDSPDILELIAQEDVDFLPYMSWQEEPRKASTSQGSISYQPLSSVSEWNKDLKLKLRIKRCKSSKLKVSKDSEVVSLGSQPPEEPGTLSSECRGVERLLDLSQMESFKQTEIKPLFTKAISQKKRLFPVFLPPLARPISWRPPLSALLRPALPTQPLRALCLVLLRIPSSCSCPTRMARLMRTWGGTAALTLPMSRVSFAGCLARAQFSKSSRGALLRVPGLHHSPLELSQGAPPAALPVSARSWTLPCSSIVFPLLPEFLPLFTAGFGCHHPGLYSQSSPASLSASYQRPGGLFALTSQEPGAAPPVDSPPRAARSEPLQCDFSRHKSSSKTDIKKTQSSLVMMFKVQSGAQSDRSSGDFATSFQARKDEEGRACGQSWRRPVPWAELFSLQTKDGFWKLTPELGFILNLDINILISFLEKKGIRSLGVKGRERLLDLVATFLVLQFLRSRLERQGGAFRSLMKLDDASVSRRIPWAFEEIRKASEWLRRTEGQYPSICWRLELGKDWDSATKQLLGMQPAGTTARPHWR
nr:LOW QUALITY PROTEIN: protein mono-ADP-ribosyltransferase PARP4 [Vicugna pacos]